MDWDEVTPAEQARRAEARTFELLAQALPQAVIQRNLRVGDVAVDGVIQLPGEGLIAVEVKHLGSKTSLDNAARRIRDARRLANEAAYRLRAELSSSGDDGRVAAIVVVTPSTGLKPTERRPAVFELEDLRAPDLHTRLSSLLESVGGSVVEDVLEKRFRPGPPRPPDPQKLLPLPLARVARRFAHSASDDLQAFEAGTLLARHACIVLSAVSLAWASRQPDGSFSRQIFERRAPRLLRKPYYGNRLTTVGEVADAAMRDGHDMLGLAPALVKDSPLTAAVEQAVGLRNDEAHDRLDTRHAAQLRDGAQRARELVPGLVRQLDVLTAVPWVIVRDMDQTDEPGVWRLSGDDVLTDNDDLLPAPDLMRPYSARKNRVWLLGREVGVDLFPWIWLETCPTCVAETWYYPENVDYSSGKVELLAFNHPHHAIVDRPPGV